MKLAIILLIMISKTFSLWCVDGNDCDATCSFCEGAACLRVQRQHPTRGVTTAMTCLPHDSLVHAYHPEGCRTELATGEKLCLCSGRDFCNSSKSQYVRCIDGPAESLGGYSSRPSSMPLRKLVHLG